MTRIADGLRAHIVLVAVVSVLGSMLVLGTVVYHFLEEWTWVDSFYFTVCTLTTVGYGDMYPTTDASRLFTAVFALAGVGVAFASLGALGAMYLKRGEMFLTKMVEVRR